MKKVLVALIVVLFSLFVCVAANDIYSFPISGIVRSDLVFTVSIFEEALPFDLDSTLVNFNASSQSFATGIRIGTYTLVSRTPNIKLCVEHTPLVHTNQALTEKNQINYRLYLMTTDTSQSFFSTTGGMIEIKGTDVQDKGVVSLIDEYMYVTLDEGSEGATNDIRSELETGIYRSTITFSVWVQT